MTDLSLTLDAAAAEIRNAPDLYDLHQALIEFDDACRESDEFDGNDSLDTEVELKQRGIDICELPTFGGDIPLSTIEVWSWDKDSILCGVGPCREWKITDRTETA